MTTFTAEQIASRTDMHTTIGMLCQRWAVLEYDIAMVIWKLLGTTPKVGQIITSRLMMSPRLDMAIDLAMALSATKEQISALKFVRKRLKDGLEARRNQAVHGLRFPGDDQSFEYFETHRGKQKGRHPLTKFDIWETCEGIKECYIILSRAWQLS